VTTAWKPEPAGTPDDLRDIALLLDPDEQVVRLDVRLRAIATTLLIELHFAKDKPGLTEERERYKRIAKGARQLQRDLAAVASRGMLLNPLGRVWAMEELKETSSREDVVSPPRGIVPSSFNIGYALCSRWGKDAHPLFLVNKAAKHVVASLKPYARLADPKGNFARACAKLWQDVRREPPDISERGELADLTKRLWKYALGTDAPGLGSRAKTAARGMKLRKSG
jgi:hypothetical protein